MGTADSAARWRSEIRRAEVADADGVAGLAGELAQSFTFSAECFHASFAGVVRGHDRGKGVGAALMGALERWASAEGCALVALATRRGAPFYLALGYEESAAYFRKVLDTGGA